MLNRVGKALLFAIFITGVLMATGYENYDKGNLPSGAKVAIAVVLRFLIFFGILNLVHFYKVRKEKKDQ